MLFNSISYLFFLPIVAIILYLIHGRYQCLWLLMCSTFFYYSLLPGYLILFYVLVLLNYYLGITIEKSELKRNSIFVFSVFVNLAVLAVFKYFGGLESLFIYITKLSVNDNLLKVILPVGLSFFIFTILSYLIEIKRGTITAERNLVVFASSLLFFPKIMQGPIEKPGTIFFQFRAEKSFNYDLVVEGLKLILWGYFKKLVVADRLAIYVNAVYGNFKHHTGISLLLATIFFSFQIYADFSGYTDIALGSAKVLGFNLTSNFRRPYFATSIREFWNRWHISFSVWLRDYLFLPLAFFFNRQMSKAKYLGIAMEKWIFMFASMITFAVCGLWHGEGLNFLIWGLLFGFYLTVANWTLGFNKIIRKRLGISRKSVYYRIYCILVTFILVAFAWVFFRANNVTDAFIIIKKISTLKGSVYTENPSMLIYSVSGIFLMLLVELKWEYYENDFSLFNSKSWIIRNLTYAAIAILILLIGVFDGGQFIYFQF